MTSTLLRCLLAAASLASVTALASAPVGWHGLQWVGLVGFLIALEGTQKRAACAIGFSAGLGANLSLFTWLVPATATYGGIPTAAAAGMFAVLVCALSLQHALVAVIDAGVRARRPQARWWVFLAAWILLEWLWPRLFPWHLGTPQVANVWVVQLAALGGPLLISSVLLASNLALFELLRWATGRGPAPRGSVAAAAAGVVLVAVAQPGASTRRPLRIGYVQPGVVRTPVNGLSEAEVWKPLLDGARQVSGDPGGAPALTIYPEGIFPWLFVDPLPPTADADPKQVARLARELRLERQQLTSLARASASPILIGSTVHRLRATAGDWETVERRNAILHVRPVGVVGRYDKRRLLPLAENLPLEATFPSLRSLIPFAGRMSPGTGARRLTVAGVRVGPLICFEGVWSGAVRELFREGPVDVLVNTTNDTWFPGQGPHLHDMIVRLRAVEARCPIVRVTTDGVSSVTHASGSSILLGRRGAAAAGVVEVAPGSQPTLYVRTGDAPLGCLALLFLIGFVGSELRARRRADPTR